MQTIQFDIEDNKVDTFLTLIENLKDGMINNLKVLATDTTDKEFQSYMQTTQFQKDKEMLQQRFEDIQSGKTKCIPWDEGFSDLDAFIDNVS